MAAAIGRSPLQGEGIKQSTLIPWSCTSYSCVNCLVYCQDSLLRLLIIFDSKMNNYVSNFKIHFCHPGTKLTNDIPYCTVIMSLSRLGLQCELCDNHAWLCRNSSSKIQELRLFNDNLVKIVAFKNRRTYIAYVTCYDII